MQTTTQDCIHTVWKGFVRYLSPLAHSHVLQPVIIKTEPFWNSPPRGSAGSYTPKSRSINLIPNSPPQRRIYLDVETSTFIAPSGRHPTASCTLSNGGCEPSTPPVDPTTLSLCHQKSSNFRCSTTTPSNVTQDDFKHPSAEKWTLTTTREFDKHMPVHQDTLGTAGNVWRNKETDPHSRKRFLCADQQVPGSDAVAFVREERRSPANSPRHDFHEHPSTNIAREQHLTLSGMSSAKRTSLKSSRPAES